MPRSSTADRSVSAARVVEHDHEPVRLDDLADRVVVVVEGRMAALQALADHPLDVAGDAFEVRFDLGVEHQRARTDEGLVVVAQGQERRDRLAQALRVDEGEVGHARGKRGDQAEHDGAHAVEGEVAMGAALDARARDRRWPAGGRGSAPRRSRVLVSAAESDPPGRRLRGLPGDPGRRRPTNGRSRGASGRAASRSRSRIPVPISKLAIASLPSAFSSVSVRSSSC